MRMRRIRVKQRENRWKNELVNRPGSEPINLRLL
jgi:hypothetical protein